MTEPELNAILGIFDPAALRNLNLAFAKAELHLGQIRSSSLTGIDRDDIARSIVFEARCGEIQPDLAWRAATAKVLLEAKRKSSKAARKSSASAGDKPMPAEASKRSGAAELPAAGPHATPGRTNVDATPGAGALPSDTIGTEVDPGTG
jgi:hypothetical protein